MVEFGDYLIFVDESGDAGLKNIDRDYPILTLAFIIIHKDDYVNNIVSSFTALKLKYWGHDEIVFHEHDIRRAKGDFAFLRTDKNLRNQFMNDLNEIIHDNIFQIISASINKSELVNKYTEPFNPYDLALIFCLENTFDLLYSLKQKEKIIYLIFEARGKNEDQNLEFEFIKIINNQLKIGRHEKNYKLMDFRLRFADKKTNSIGLQLADLIARPIGIKSLRSEQENRAYDIIKTKQNIHKNFP